MHIQIALSLSGHSENQSAGLNGRTQGERYRGSVGEGRLFCSLFFAEHQRSVRGKDPDPSVGPETQRNRVGQGICVSGGQIWVGRRPR